VTKTITEQEKVKATLNIILAVATAIKDLREVPVGTLYAQLMGHMDLDLFEQIIGYLVNSGAIQRTPSYLLVWKGQNDGDN